MVRMFLVAAILAGVPAQPHAQSASAPLIVTATVVSTCRVEVPRDAEPGLLATLPVAVTCARRGVAARVQHPSPPPRRSDMRDAVLVIDF